MANEIKNMVKELEKADITTPIPDTAKLPRHTIRQPYNFTKGPLMIPGRGYHTKPDIQH